MNKFKRSLPRIQILESLPYKPSTMEPESHVDPPMHLIKPVVEIEKIYDQDQDVSPVTIQLDIPRVVVPINHSQGTEYPTAASFIQGMAANDR